MRILMYNTFGFSSASWNVYEGFARELETKGFDVCRVSDPSWNSRPLWRDILFRKKFERLIKTLKPDLIHIHSIRTPLGMSLTSIARKHRVPLVATVHTYRIICPITLRSQPRPFHTRNPCNFIYPHPHCFKCVVSDSVVTTSVRLAEMPFYMYMLRHMYKSANAVISPSALLADLLRHVGLGNVVHIPNLVSRHEIERFSLDTYSVEQHTRSILFVGRLAPEKGVALIPIVAGKLKDTQIHVVGTGPLYGWLADHNPGNLILHGFISDEEKYSLMSECSLLFVPSVWADLYPTVILEAFVLGKPVVAFDYAGSKEMVESSGGGLLATPFDVISLIRSIKYLLENPLVSKEKGFLGRMWAMKTAHPDIVIKKLIAIYNNLVTRAVTS